MLGPDGVSARIAYLKVLDPGMVGGEIKTSVSAWGTSSAAAAADSMRVDTCSPNVEPIQDRKRPCT